MILVHQDPEKREYVVSPDAVWQAEIEPTALVWDETAAMRDLAFFDVGKDFASVVVDTQGTRGATKSFMIKVSQQFEDGDRPRVARAPYRRTDPDNLRECKLPARGRSGIPGKFPFVAPPHSALTPRWTAGFQPRSHGWITESNLAHQPRHDLLFALVAGND